VDDIWRVVLFLKTIPNGTLKPNVIPEPKDYIVWKPTPELLAWVKAHQHLEGNASFAKQRVEDPFMQEAMRVFPGLAPGDKVVVDGLQTTLDLESAAGGIRTIYEDLLRRAWSDAGARDDKLPARSQAAIAPSVPGQQ
jgi:cytochrome c oxidase cbb3-type subunit II